MRKAHSEHALVFELFMKLRKWVESTSERIILSKQNKKQILLHFLEPSEISEIGSRKFFDRVALFGEGHCKIVEVRSLIARISQRLAVRKGLSQTPAQLPKRVRSASVGPDTVLSREFQDSMIERVEPLPSLI